MKKPKILMSGEEARNDMAGFIGLSDEQRAELHSDPDKFIDDNFANECCGETRAFLNGGAEWKWVYLIIPLLGTAALFLLVYSLCRP